MGIVFRQSVKTTLVAILGAVLGAVIIWMGTKFIPTQREFGFTRNLTLQAVNLSQLLVLGMQSTLSVYIHKYADHAAKRKTLLSLCLGIPFIACVLFSLLYFSFKSVVLKHTHTEDVPLTDHYYYWLPIYTLLFVYMAMLELYLGSQMRNAIAAFMREVVVRVLSIVTLLLFAFGALSFGGYVTAMVLVYLVPVLIFIVLSLGTSQFGLSFNFRVFSKTEYVDIVRFSWYHLLLTIAFTVISNLDSLMLPFSDKNGFVDSGIYALALYIISFVQLPSKAMITPTFAVMAKAYTDNDTAKVKDVFNRSSLNILIATTGMALLICCNLDNAVSVIKSGYEQIIPVYMILFVGRYIDLATGMNDQLLSIANYYKFNFYVALLMLPLFYFILRVLIHNYGIIGAAWSSAIIYISFNLVKYLFIWYKMNIQPFSYRSLLVIIAAVPALAVGYGLQYLSHRLFEQHRHVYIHSFIDAGVRCIIIGAVYVIMLLWLKPSPDMQEYIATIKKNKRLF